MNAAEVGENTTSTTRYDDNDDDAPKNKTAGKPS